MLLQESAKFSRSNLRVEASGDPEQMKGIIGSDVGRSQIGDIGRVTMTAAFGRTVRL